MLLDNHHTDSRPTPPQSPRGIHQEALCSVTSSLTRRPHTSNPIHLEDSPVCESTPQIHGSEPQDQATVEPREKSSLHRTRPGSDLAQSPTLMTWSGWVGRPDYNSQCWRHGPWSGRQGVYCRISWRGLWSMIRGNKARRDRAGEMGFYCRPTDSGLISIMSTRSSYCVSSWIRYVWFIVSMRCFGGNAPGQERRGCVWRLEVGGTETLLIVSDTIRDMFHAISRFSLADGRYNNLFCKAYTLT